VTPFFGKELLNMNKETRQKPTLLIVAILVLVLLARLVFVMTYRGGDFNPAGQMTSWSRIALNLASGKGYVYDSEAPTARRGPVPILFLALLFSVFGPQAFPVPIVLSQWLWDAASALLIYFIVIELFGTRRAALLAMTLFALHPVIIENSVRVNVEPLATFLLLAFVLTLLRALRNPEWFRFVGPGIFLGLSILCGDGCRATLQHTFYAACDYVERLRSCKYRNAGYYTRE